MTMWISAYQFAKLAGLNTSHVQQLVKRGLLPAKIIKMPNAKRALVILVPSELAPELSELFKEFRRWKQRRNELFQRLKQVVPEWEGASVTKKGRQKVRKVNEVASRS